jgi:serine/threonine-protein kinase
MDIDRLELAGTSVPMLEDVASRPGDGGADFEFSRSGTFVYQSGKSRSPRTVQWLHKSGVLEPLLSTPAAYDAVRLSPDGTRLALVIQESNPDIWVYHLERRTLARLTLGGANEAPLWSRDGRHLAYLSGQNSAIFWMRADGSGDAPRLISSGTIANSVSPDGKRLAIEIRTPDAQADIATLELEDPESDHPRTGQPDTFLNTAASEREPAFSPDGHWLAYVSDESGSNQIYVRPFPGKAPRASGKWQISTEGGMTPIWSPKGRDLFYVSSDRRIMVTSYAAQDGLFQADKPTRWSDAEISASGQSVTFVTRVLDLTPDGRRFAVVVPSNQAQPPPTHVNVLLNFFDELRRRTAERK